MASNRTCKTAALLLAATLPVFAQQLQQQQQQPPQGGGTDLASCMALQKRAIGIGLDDDTSKKQLDLCMFQFWEDLWKPGNFLAHKPPELDLNDGFDPRDWQVNG